MAMTSDATDGYPLAPSKVAAVAMHDDYAGKTARIQKETLERSYKVALDALRNLCDKEQGPWCIMDLGVADGIHTFPLFKGCVDAIREKDQSCQILLVFEDQACNDFRRVTATEGSMFGDNVFPIITNKSFFEATMPDGMVHLSFSSTSMHYLAGPPPCNITTCGIHPVDARGKERAAFAAMAEENWEQLLLARAKELAPGGVTVISNLCIDESNGWYYGSTDRGQSLYTNIGEIMHEMMEEGLITKLECDWATSPEYYRTVAELKKPFTGKNSVTEAGLILQSAEVQVARCPLNASFQAGEYSDAEAYGRDVAHCATAFSYHKCMRAFKHPGNTRTNEEQTAIVDKVYDRLAARVAADPLEFGHDTVCLVMVIQKCRAVG